MRDLTDHFVSLLVGFGARVGIIDPAHTGHFGNEFFRKQRTRDRSRGTSKVVHLDQLIAYRIGNPLTAIADIYGPHTPGHSVQMLFAVLVPDTHAFAFNDDPWIDRFKRFMLDQMMPNMGFVCVNYARQVIGC
jgi:hypothetical protein